MNIKLILASAICLSAFSLSSCDDDEHYIDATEEDAEMVLQGKVGNDASANMVYVDFSTNQQHAVARRSWHLGFYCGEEFHVTLNQSLSRAWATEKTDFAAVTVEDAEKAPNLAAGMMEFGTLANVKITDDTSHDLNKTLFGTIESEPSKSKVFLLATEEMTQCNTWYKVKVTKTSNGYKVEYGRVNDQEPTVKEIAKDAEKTFIYFSLQNGKTVDVPEKWDIMWSSAMANNTMPNGRVIFGPASDVITTNSYKGVETAIVIVDKVCSYDEFSMAHIKEVEFHKEADVIGTSWRTAPMPGSTPGPLFDRFYVTKGTDGRFYKYVFLSFCEEDGGERGLPELMFAAIEQ